MIRPTPIAAALFTLFTSPLSVWAQQNTSTNNPPKSAAHSVQVEGVRNDFAPGIIRAGKLDAELLDIPQSVTIVNKELMQSQGANSLADALRNVSGITLGGAEGGQIGNNINLNGFSARTDIYLDGFRDRGQYYRDTFALDSIEVLMGPSSMLFGRGSTGGVINQVTKKPLLKNSTEIAGSITSNGLVRTTMDFNTPLSDTSALRVLGMAQNGDGSTRDLSHKQDVGIASSLKLGINTPTEITLSALLQKNNDQTDWGILPLNGAPAAVPRDTAYGLDNNRTISDVISLNSTIEHRVTSEITVRNLTQFNSVKTDARETSPNAIGTISLTGFAPLPTPGLSNLPLSDLAVRLQSKDRAVSDYSIFNQTEIIADVVTGQFNHHLIMGLELGHDGYDSQSYFRQGSCNGMPLNAAGATSSYVACGPLLNPTFNPSSVIQKTGNRSGGSANTVATYINDTVDLNAHFKLTGGLRYDRYTASITNSINATNTPGSTALAHARQSIGLTSVRLGALWQPHKQQSYYLSYGTSFNPSLEQLTGTAGQQDLPPEKNRSYELGGKWQLADQHLETSAAIFQIQKNNARTLISPGVYDLVGEVRVNGFRAGAFGRVHKNVQLAVNYTYLDALITKAADGTQGNVPANTPKNNLTAWAIYKIAPNWEVGGGPIYMSQRFANHNNTVKVGGFTRWDATVAYDQPQYTIRLNLFNLSNKMYYESLIPSDGGRAVPGTGRAAMLSFTYKI